MAQGMGCRQTGRSGFKALSIAECLTVGAFLVPKSLAFSPRLYFRDSFFILIFLKVFFLSCVRSVFLLFCIKFLLYKKCFFSLLYYKVFFSCFVFTKAFFVFLLFLY